MTEKQIHFNSVISLLAAIASRNEHSTAIKNGLAKVLVYHAGSISKNEYVRMMKPEHLHYKPQRIYEVSIAMGMPLPQYRQEIPEAFPMRYLWSEIPPHVISSLMGATGQAPEQTVRFSGVEGYKVEAAYFKKREWKAALDTGDKELVHYMIGITKGIIPRTLASDEFAVVGLAQEAIEARCLVKAMKVIGKK